jgi:hypothetical protein
MRSSFLLCQQMLPYLKNLDLAVGIEYGPVPLTRVGSRGEESVRCAAGRAVVVAEQMQQSIDGGGIKMGPVAEGEADANVRRHFASASSIIEYDAAVDLLGAVASPAVAISRENPSARPYLERTRE